MNLDEELEQDMLKHDVTYQLFGIRSKMSSPNQEAIIRKHLKANKSA